MSERYRPLEEPSNEKERRTLSPQGWLERIERQRKSGEVLPSKEREPVPGATGDDSQQAPPPVTDDANQNNGQSDSTAPVSQSDNQQQKVDDGQLERERLQRIEQARTEIARLQRIEQIRAEIAQIYAKGDKHASFRPDQSQGQRSVERD